MGIDLSSTTDTTAVTTCIERGDKIYIWADIFIPEDNAEGRFIRQRRDRAPYMTWVKQGHIRATPGNTVDYAAVENRILELSAMFDLIEIQADPYNASGLLERLIKAGLHVVTVRQGWSLAQATKEAERLILARGLVHPNNPAFTFQVSSAAVKQDDRENQWITKARSAARVDAAVAMVMAINAMKFSGVNTTGDAKHNAPWTGDLIVI
jgi:phage terminase large subunit-like protein